MKLECVSAEFRLIRRHCIINFYIFLRLTFTRISNPFAFEEPNCNIGSFGGDDAVQRSAQLDRIGMESVDQIEKFSDVPTSDAVNPQLLT